MITAGTHRMGGEWGRDFMKHSQWPC